MKSYRPQNVTQFAFFKPTKYSTGCAPDAGVRSGGHETRNLISEDVVKEMLSGRRDGSINLLPFKVPRQLS